MYVIVFILQCQKVKIRLPNCVKRTEASFVLVVFNGVLYYVRAYTTIVSYHYSP